MQDGLKIYIRYTWKDLRAVSFKRVYRTLRGRISLFLPIFLIFLFAFTAIIPFFLELDWEMMDALIFILPLLIIIALILLPGVINYFYQRHNFKKSKLLSETQCFEFLEDQVRISSKNGSFSLDWNDIYRVRELKQGFLMDQSPAKSYLIPRRCFESQAQLELFRGMLSDKVNKKKLKLKRYRLRKSMPDSAEEIVSDTVKPEEISSEYSTECNPLLEVDFHILKNDLLRFVFRQYYTRPAGLIITGVGVLLFYSAIRTYVAGLYAAEAYAATADAWVVSLVLGILFVFVMPVSVYIKVTRQYENDIVFKKPYSFKFFDDCFIVDHPKGINRIYWKDLVKVRETKTAFLFFPTLQIAHFIPKRAFENRETDMRLLSELVIKVRKVTEQQDH